MKSPFADSRNILYFRKSTRFRKQHDKTSLASKYAAPSTASADSDFGGNAANNNSRGACFENARQGHARYLLILTSFSNVRYKR